MFGSLIAMTDDREVEEPLTKSMYAYQVLRRRVLNGELAPGERLLLRPLAEQLGLSVMPVRDALRMLERDGLVQSETHRGTTVTQIDANTIVDLIGIRMWLEVLAVQEATPRHDHASLAIVRESLRAADQAVAGEPLEYSRANRTLHEAIEAPASSELQRLIAELWEKVWQARRRMSLFSLVPEMRTRAQKEHRSIVAALKAADTDAAVEAMTRHRDSTLTVWRHALGDITNESPRRVLPT